MSRKNKTLFIIYTLLTLGVFLLVVNLKKKSAQTNSELSLARKTSVDIAALKQALGAENIMGVEYTHTKVKFFVADRKKVDVSGLQKMPGISGIYLTSKFVAIIVGPSARIIAESFKESKEN